MSNSNTPSVGIIGYGRFGKLLASILASDFRVYVYDKANPHIKHGEKTNLATILKQKNIFIATPINQFKSVVQSLANQLSEDTTLIDVCSIKLHPVEIMQTYLPKSVGIIATHPLFGPDSINKPGLRNFMIYPVRDTHKQYPVWKHFFEKQFNLVEMTPDEHDRLAAQSQGVVHFISRFLNAANLTHTAIDTAGFQQLMKLVEDNCKDSWELFVDLQRYNPYSKPIIERLQKAFNDVKREIEW